MESSFLTRPMIGNWTLTGFCLVLVAVRLYVRLTTTIRPWRELLLIFAFIILLFNAISITIRWATGFGDMIVWVQFTITKYPPETQSMWWKLTVATNLISKLGLYACQALALIHYQEICSRSRFPVVYRLIMVTWATVIFGALGCQLIGCFLQCLPDPISYAWSLTEACYTYKYSYVSNSFLLFSDLLVYLIPVLIISKLDNLEKWQKVSAAAMFSIGFISVASTIGFISLAFRTFFTEYTESRLEATYWLSSLQLPTAIMVLCIPQARVLGRMRVVKSVLMTLSNKRTGEGSADDDEVNSEERFDRASQRLPPTMDSIGDDVTIRCVLSKESSETFKVVVSPV